MRSVLITGVSGFIGSRLRERLLQGDYKIIGTGRGLLNPGLNNFSYLQADLTNLKECFRIIQNVDYVVHCAGKAGVWGSEESYQEANVLTLKNLLMACEESGVKRFINLSSPSIYFDYRDRLNLREEELPSKFSNAYAKTKFIAEEMVSQANSTKLMTLSLRPRGVIGAGDRNWLPRIIELRRNNSLIQPGAGENIVDFTSANNLLDVIEFCLKTNSKECFGEVYNISNGKPEKLWDVIDYLLRGVGLDSSRKKVPLPIAMGLAKASEFFHLIKGSEKEPKILPLKVGVANYSMTLDISKAEKKLAYVPRIGTYEAIDEFIESFKNMEAP